eukprot:3645895-Rhodomonas_salina.4
MACCVCSLLVLLKDTVCSHCCWASSSVEKGTKERERDVVDASERVEERGAAFERRGLPDLKRARHPSVRKTHHTDQRFGRRTRCRQPSRLQHAQRRMSRFDLLHPSPFIPHRFHHSSLILFILLPFHPTPFTLHPFHPPSSYPPSSILYPPPSHPASYILHPTSCVLHPASYILHPASCILHPASCILMAHRH